MRPRVRFGDETWRLALAGDVAALERASELLLGGDLDIGYDGHRARAFARALGGRGVEEALAELNEGWTDDWPLPSGYALDVARVHFLAGDAAAAIDALELSVRSADVPDPSVQQLAAACVARDARTFRGALTVALAAGTPWQRLRAAAAVVGARF